MTVAWDVACTADASGKGCDSTHSLGHTEAENRIDRCVLAVVAGILGMMAGGRALSPDPCACVAFEVYLAANLEDLEYENASAVSLAEASVPEIAHPCVHQVLSCSCCGSQGQESKELAGYSLDRSLAHVHHHLYLDLA